MGWGGGDQTGGVRTPRSRRTTRSSGSLTSTALIVLAALTVPACAVLGGDDDRAATAVLVPSQTGGDPGGDPGSAVGVPLAERPTTVAMVGDSITVASAAEVEAALTELGLDVLLVDAQVGRRMTVGERDRLVPGADVVEYVSAVLEPELWVVALGTNDIGQYPEVGRVAEQVAEILGHIPDGVPVVWVDTWIRDRPDQARAVNEAIRSVVGGRAASSVVDWATHATADGVLSGDGVHLTDGLGRIRFAEVVAAGVETLIGPAPTP